jgi:hypothetical protein
MYSSKPLAVIMSVVISLAVLWPVTENLKKKPVDRFPFSYYPMFSYKRNPVHTLHYVIGYDSAGNRHYIGYNYIGSGGFNQVRRQVNKKVRKGEAEAVLLKTAKRIAKAKKPPYTQIVKIELAKGSFNFDTYYLTGNKLPATETILATKKIELP